PEIRHGTLYPFLLVEPVPRRDQYGDARSRSAWRSLHSEFEKSQEFAQSDLRRYLGRLPFVIVGLATLLLIVAGSLGRGGRLFALVGRCVAGVTGRVVLGVACRSRLRTLGQKFAAGHPIESYLVLLRTFSDEEQGPRCAFEALHPVFGYFVRLE